MPATKHKARRDDAEDVRRFVLAADGWCTLPPTGLVDEIAALLKTLQQACLDFSESFPAWRNTPNLDQVYSLFSADHMDSCFSAPALDWSIRMTEPDITRTIARMLDARSTPMIETSFIAKSS